MAGTGNGGLKFAKPISAIREFNRFYTARIGLLQKRHLGSQYSLTEARLLYEIATHPLTTSSALRFTLKLDAGYISRLLGSLASRKLLRQVTSKTDGREKHLKLTALGRKVVTEIDRQSDKQIRGMLEGLSADDLQTLVTSLEKARKILNRDAGPTTRIKRLTTIDSAAMAILEEYYEAVHVVQRDEPGKIQPVVKQPASGMWLAYLDDEVVGCVVLRRLEHIPFASECKRLYVRPSARGNRISDKLLDAQEEFARCQGLKWIYLDSYDGLKAAIAVYERRGYERCERYNNNPQATLFMRKKII